MDVNTHVHGQDDRVLHVPAGSDYELGEHKQDGIVPGAEPDEPKDMTHANFSPGVQRMMAHRLAHLSEAAGTANQLKNHRISFKELMSLYMRSTNLASRGKMTVCGSVCIFVL